MLNPGEFDNCFTIMVNSARLLLSFLSPPPPGLHWQVHDHDSLTPPLLLPGLTLAGARSRFSHPFPPSPRAYIGRCMITILSPLPSFSPGLHWQVHDHDSLTPPLLLPGLTLAGARSGFSHPSPPSPRAYIGRCMIRILSPLPSFSPGLHWQVQDHDSLTPPLLLPGLTLAGA